MQENITMKCTVCGQETYITTKDKKKNPEKLELSKYCPVCKKATIHKEKK